MLLDWINDVLAEERIIVKQLEEDLYDGQVLQKLLGECRDPTMWHHPPCPGLLGTDPKLGLCLLAALAVFAVRLHGFSAGYSWFLTGLQQLLLDAHAMDQGNRVQRGAMSLISSLWPAWFHPVLSTFRMGRGRGQVSNKPHVREFIIVLTHTSRLYCLQVLAEDD